MIVFFTDAIAGKENIYKENKLTKGELRRYIAPSGFTRNSIIALIKFYNAYENELESIRETMKISDKIEYPQMKLLDMGFWQLGYEAEKRKPQKSQNKA